MYFLIQSTTHTVLLLKNLEIQSSRPQCKELVLHSMCHNYLTFTSTTRPTPNQSWLYYALIYLNAYGAGTRYLRCLFFVQQHSEAAGNKRMSSTLQKSCRCTPWQAEEKIQEVARMQMLSFPVARSV